MANNGMRRRSRMAALALTLILAVTGCAGGGTAPEKTADGSAADTAGQKVTREWGYLALPNGGESRYTVLRPDSKGPHPVLIEYDGYSAGSDPSIGKRWVQEGYAVVGVNVPGTGCSTGTNGIFDESVGAAGAFAVEWAAKQPWSNGRVGMVGYSYSGYNQLWTAAQKPAGLLAITPSKNVADPYRDVAYPGGIQNVGFPAGWWGRFPEHWSNAAKLAADLDSDTRCRTTAADNIAKARHPEVDLEVWLDNDRFDGYRYAEKSALLRTSRIELPALAIQSWQDEQVGPRAGYFEETLDPEKTWLLSANGDHHTDDTSAVIDDTLKRFFAHFVKGERNGFEREAHVRLLQEMQAKEPGNPDSDIEPRSIAEFDRLPVPVTPMRLWMQHGGGLTDEIPAADGGVRSDYRYPVESPVVNNPADEGWKPVTAPNGQLTFTTAALPDDLSFYGEGSADLWLGSTAPDTDVQVTVSEVRPDGREMFVQRGWLRASMRQLDEPKSTELRPWGAFTESAAQPLIPGEPTPMRVEIQKFAHVFRSGSSIRITIDTPSQTGFWVFGNQQSVSTNTVWTDPAHPSSIVLGQVPYNHAESLPDCDATSRQPCRTNTVPVPQGSGPHPPGR
ncbi:CocE/NonD family hydrolase [Rhodococcus qingshengii]|uniref:CocE/NonD family hydrolase n=1 Tax=Rhodococcus qingshengii TaxID=334542 RepID=UPI0036DC5BF3